MEAGAATERSDRELNQLLRLQRRIVGQLQRVRRELDAPSSQTVLAEIRRRTGTQVAHNMGEVRSAVEEAIRVLKVAGSEVHDALSEDREAFEIEGIDNLPPTLERFMGERNGLPGFSYDVVQDEVRGWVIRWKEMGGNGVVRGFGQFYERPYAWIED